MNPKSEESGVKLNLSDTAKVDTIQAVAGANVDLAVSDKAQVNAIHAEDKNSMPSIKFQIKNMLIYAFRVNGKPELPLTDQSIKQYKNHAIHFGEWWKQQCMRKVFLGLALPMTANRISKNMRTG